MQNINNNAGIMITLGHNSSVLFYDGQRKPIGYEEERLNGIKSSSAFPIKSLERILEQLSQDDLRGATIFISHWFDVYDPSLFPKKYYDKEYIDNMVKLFDMRLVLLSKEFSHHDAHAYSSLAFLKDSLRKEYPKNGIRGNMFYIVADGFGNEEEVLSIYRDGGNVNELELVDRLYGYDKSLGLLYQYATSFCGMKEMQDEYKFLGYESRIEEILRKPDTIKRLDRAVDVYYKNFCEYIFNSKRSEIDRKIYTGSEHLDLKELNATREQVYEMLTTILRVVFKSEQNLPTSEEYNRIIIGYFIQSCVEKVLSFIVSHYGMQNVCLSGGCFYNVKLNNSILKNINGNVCVVPVAGDQGAAIGMYQKEFANFDFSDLCFGVRELPKVDIDNSERGNIIFCSSEEQFIETTVALLHQDKIVNIMHGNMEFGPRALCNTSTLALPTAENVKYINYLNDRNSVMPMAPVILDRNVYPIFENTHEIDRVIGSNRFMIMTHDIGEEAAKSDTYQGIIHKYPNQDLYSGRPQIVSRLDGVIGKILDVVHSLALINTSFNTHGTPILYNSYDAVRDFRLQRKNDFKDRNYLIILTNDK